MNNGNKKPKLTKNQTINIVVGVIGLAAAGTVAGVLKNELSNKNDDPKALSSLLHAITKPTTSDLLEFNSAEIQFNNSNDSNIGRVKTTDTFYTIFDLIKNDFNIKTTVQQALDKGVQINGTTYSTAAGWVIEGEPDATNGSLKIKKNGSSETKTLFDNAGYYTRKIPIGHAFETLDENGVYQYTHLQDYTNFLDTLKDNTFHKLNESTFIKIRTFIQSLNEPALNNISLSKLLVDGKQLIIVNGTDKNRQNVTFVINELPIVYKYDDLKDELPTYQEVEAANFDYAEAVFQKIRSSSKDKVFNNTLVKSNINQKEGKVKIIVDGTIEVNDGINTMLITPSKTGYQYIKYDRSVEASKTDAKNPYNYDLEEISRFLELITTKGNGLDNAIQLSSVVENKLYNSLLAQYKISAIASKIYYDSIKSRLVIVDDSNYARKVLVLENIPNIITIDSLMKFKDTTNKNHNKPLISIDEVAEKTEFNKKDFKEIISDLLIEKLTLAKDNQVGSIYVSGDISKAEITEEDKKLYPTNAKFEVFKVRVTQAGFERFIYALNRNNFYSANGDIEVFKDKVEYEKNEGNVVTVYLTVKDVKLTQLDNFVNNFRDNNSNNQTNDQIFNKDKAKIKRHIQKLNDGSHNDKFIVIDTDRETSNSKVLIIYGLPRVITTNEAFNDFGTEASIDKLIESAIADKENKKSSKELYLDILNKQLKRKSGDNNKAFINGNEFDFNPTASSNSQSARIDFDIEKNKHLIELKKQDNNQDIIFTKIRIEKGLASNPNGIIPQVKKAKWSPLDSQSLEFFALYDSLANDSTNSKAKVLTSEVLNYEFIRVNTGLIAQGTIEYRYDEGLIIIKDPNIQEAVIFTDVPKLALVQDVFKNMSKNSIHGIASNIVDAMVSKYNNTNSLNEYNNKVFIEDLVTKKTSGELVLGNYKLSKDSSKQYTTSVRIKNNLDDGPNNAQRRYKTFVYEVTETSQQDNKVKIYDDVNYIDSKRAYELYSKTVPMSQWKAIYDLIGEKKTYADGVSIEQIKLAAPKLATKLLADVSNEGFGFLDTKPDYLTNNTYPTKLFIIDRDGNKELVIAGLRKNKTGPLNATDNRAILSILSIQQIPNIAKASEISLSMPTLEEVVAADGNLEEAIKANIEKTDKKFNFEYKYTKNVNGNLTLDKHQVKFDFDKSDKREYVRLYKGANNSFGSITIFSDQPIINVIGTDYTKPTDYEHTLKYWQGFGANSTLSAQQKEELIRELIQEQEKSDRDLRNYKFNVSNKTTIELNKDSGKLIIFEDGSKKVTTKIVVVYNVPKVISNHEIFENTSTSLKTELQVLGEFEANTLKAVRSVLLNKRNEIVKNAKAFGISIKDNEPMIFDPQNKRITFGDHVVNVVFLEEYEPVHARIFNNVNSFKDLVSNQLKTIDQKEDISNYDSNSDVQAIKSTLANKELKKIFKVGIKIVVETEEHNKPKYYLFLSSPDFATDVTEGIVWKDVYQAIDYVNGLATFNTNVQDQLITEALKTKIKNDKIVITDKEFDPATIRYTYRFDNNKNINLIKMNGSASGELELIIQDGTRIGSVDSQPIDNIIALDKPENLTKLQTIIQTIQNAPELEKKDQKSIKSADVVASYPELKVDTYNFDRLYLDTSKNVLWLINSTLNKGYALTNIPTQTTFSIDDTKETWFKSAELLKHDLNPLRLVQARVAANSNNSIAGINFGSDSNPRVQQIGDFYLVTYNNNRLIIKDTTKYHLKPNQLISSKRYVIDAEKFKTFYTELEAKRVATAYSSLTHKYEETDELIKQNNISENAEFLAIRYGNENVILVVDTKNSIKNVYLINNLPEVVAPSKIAIPTVYDFLKYNGDEENRFSNAVKNKLDDSGNNSNQAIKLIGQEIAWNDAEVQINKSARSIKVVNKTNTNLFEINNFDYLPEYKLASINNDFNFLDKYELLKELKKLTTDSTLDKSAENKEDSSTKKRPQKQITQDFLNNKIVQSAIKQAYGVDTVFTQLDKISVEHLLATNKHDDKDRIILRLFDDQNRVIKALVITNVTRVVDNEETIKVTREEIINQILKTSTNETIAKLFETKLIEKIGSSVNTKIGDIYQYNKSIKATKEGRYILVEDPSKIDQPFVIILKTNYLDFPASINLEVFEIKNYQKNIELLNSKLDKKAKLKELNNKELNSIVIEYSENMNLEDVEVQLSDDKLIFSTNDQLLVGYNLPKIIKAYDNNNKIINELPTVDEIPKALDQTTSVVKAYEDFYKKKANGGTEFTISNTKNTPAETYKFNKDKVSFKFNDDETLKVASTDQANKTILNIILPSDLEQDSFSVINAISKDPDQTYQLIKLITDKTKETDLTEEMRKTSFLANDDNLPNEFLKDTDTIKIHYYLDLNKIVLKNETQKKTVVFYNVNRVLGSNKIYSTQDIVKADKSTQEYILDKIKNASTNPLIWDGITIEKPSTDKEVKVTNIGIANNSLVSKPGSPIAQFTVIDNYIYHIGKEKFNAEDEIVEVIDFDNWVKRLKDTEEDVSSTQIPDEVSKEIFSSLYGNVDKATAKVFKVEKDSKTLIVIKGVNKTSKLGHVIVIHNLPKVFSGDANNLPVPTIKQLASSIGLSKNDLINTDKILSNTLTKLLKDTNGNIFHTSIKANEAKIEVTRDVAKNQYSYTVSNSNSQKVTLQTKKAIPNVYAYDGTRDTLREGLKVSNFELKYEELKAKSTNNSVQYNDIKDDPIISKLLANTNVNQEAKAKIDQHPQDFLVYFDKETNRIMIGSDTQALLLIFGNIIKTATNENAIGTNQHLLYKYGEAVEASFNLSSLILRKLNELEPNELEINGYPFTKKFTYLSQQTDGSFVFKDSKSNSDQTNDNLYFVDRTTYTEKNLVDYNFTNLTKFYNDVKQALQKEPKYLLKKTTQFNNNDLTNIVNSLDFKDPSNVEIVLGGNSLALVGIDKTTNKTKVVKLIIPFVQEAPFTLNNDSLTNVVGATLDEKVANATALALKRLAKQQYDDAIAKAPELANTLNPNEVTLDGNKINLNTPNLQYVTKQDPNNINRRIVEIIKDNKVVATITMPNDLPNVKVVDWSATQATPLETWNILLNIYKNSAVEDTNENLKTIRFVDLDRENKANQSIFKVDFINKVIKNQKMESLLSENNRSIEYNKERNEIILRSANSSLVFSNVTKVVIADGLYNASKGYVDNSSPIFNSKNPRQALDQYIKVDAPKDLATQSVELKDEFNSWSVKQAKQIEDLSKEFKDSFVFKLQTNTTNDYVYVIDIRTYINDHISVKNDFNNNLNDFITTRAKLNYLEAKPVDEINSPTISKHAVNLNLEKAYIIKKQINGKDVFVLFGNKTTQREQKNNASKVSVYAPFVYVLDGLPIVPEANILLPNEADVLNSDLSHGDLIKKILENPAVYAQSGNPATINFGGQKITLPIKQVLVGDDGAVVIVDANNEQVSVPSNPTTVIYKDYNVGVDSPTPENPNLDFRFLDIKTTKGLFDLIDNQVPIKQTQRQLTDAIKQNPLLKKILNDYNNTVKTITNKDWVLDKATIEYNRSKDMIIVRDNADSNKNPRIVLIKNVPKIVYANELATNKNHIFRLVDNNFNLLDLVKNKVDEVINENQLVKTYTIGNATPNLKTKAVSAYSNLSNISAQELAYPNFPNTYVINYSQNNTNKALFVYDLTQVVKQEPSFRNFVLLHNQIKALGPQRTFNPINKITNLEVKSVVRSIFNQDDQYNKLQVTHYNGYLLFVLFNELNNPIKVLSLKLPKLIDQNNIFLPSKEDIINSTLPVSELILNSFNDPSKYGLDSDGLINIDGLKVNPKEIQIIINDDNTISIIKANTKPVQFLGRIITDSPQYPKRALINSKDIAYVNERNPEAIYELIKAINKLSFGEPTEIKLTEEMIENSYLKNKLMTAFEDDDLWFNYSATTIRYDIQNNRISIDNNNPNNAKILVINNVDRVIKDYESESSFLFEPQDIVRSFNIVRSRAYRQGKLTSDQLILSAIAKNIAKKDLSSLYNHYKLELKNDGLIIKDDISFVRVDEPTITRNKDAEPWKRYVLLKTKNDQEYIIIHDTYYHFSKLDGNQVIVDNTAYKKLVDQILKSNQQLPFDQNTTNKKELDKWVDEIKKDSNVKTNQPLYLSISAGSNLVLRTQDNKHKYFYVLNNVPIVATEKDINLKLPTDEQVLAQNGDYAKAIKAKLMNQEEFPRDKNNHINFYNISINPEKIDVISRDDGSVEFYNQEDGNRIIIAITPTILPPNYTIDNNVLDDAVLAKAIYQLIKIANAPNKAKLNQKELNQALRVNPWIKKYILDQYSDPNNPTNIDTDFSKGWTIQYYPEKNQVVLRGRNTNKQKRVQVIIINQAIKVIHDYELYSNSEVLAVDNSIQDKLAYLINQKIKTLNRVGDYDIVSPAIVSDQEYINKHATSDPKQNVKYKQIRLANNQLIVVIDNNKYLPFANGKLIFKNPLKQLELENMLKSKAKVGFDLIDKNTKQPINEELYNHLKNKLKLTDQELVNTTVSIQDGFIMISGTYEDGSKFIQKIDHNPNVVSKENIPFVSIDDVIKADGDLGAAYLKLLNDPTKYILDDNGKIEINGIKINPKDIVVKVDPTTNDLSVYEKQKDGSVKLATTIVYKTNPQEVSVKYTVAKGEDIYHAYLQDIATRIKTIEMKVENKSAEAIKVVNDILNDPIIKSYLPTGFNKSELVTVEFDNITNKIIIRDNDSSKPHVVIIKTSILQNAPIEINKQLEYNANIDYWMIIVSIVSLVAGIGLIGLIAILAIRFKNKKRTR